MASIAGDYFGLDDDRVIDSPAEVATGGSYKNSRGRNDYVRKLGIMHKSVTDSYERLGRIKNMSHIDTSRSEFHKDLKKNTPPQWMFITPNMTSDGHDSSVTTAGQWCRFFLEPLLTNSNFMQNTLVLVTWDESESYSRRNNILGILVGDAVPQQLVGTTDSSFYNHYSEISSVSANWDLPTLGRWDVGANVYKSVADKTGDKIRTWDNDQEFESYYWNDCYSSYLNSESTDKPIPKPNLSLDQNSFNGRRICIDLAASAPTEQATQLCKAFREVGFAYIKNHGIPEEKIKEAFFWSRKFFDLAQSEKDKAPHPAEGWYHRGYSSIGREKVSQNLFDKDGLAQHRKVPDQKESFELGRENDDVMTNIWPPAAALPGFREFFVDFYNLCNGLEDKLLAAVAVGLGLSADYFDACHRGRDNQLRLLHYPPFAAELLESGQADCIGAHSDFGTMTLLFQDDVGGLEIEDQGGTESEGGGRFRPVPCVPGTIVVNIGDMLMRWTNDELRSTIHRVRTPAEVHVDPGTGVRMTRRRYSMPFFICADPSTVVDCVPTCHGRDRSKRYEPVTAEEYFTMRMNALY
ncbi:hypothetical protein ARSEF4850_009867 [Beauveria asiatica]